MRHLVKKQCLCIKNWSSCWEIHKPLSKSRAVVALSRMGKVNPVAVMKEALQVAGSGAESLLILNDITYLHEEGLGGELNLQKSDILQKCSGTDWRLKYLSAE